MSGNNMKPKDAEVSMGCRASHNRLHWEAGRFLPRGSFLLSSPGLSLESEMKTRKRKRLKRTLRQYLRRVRKRRKINE